MEIDSPTQLALISYLRHELRTPINAIIGYSEMLLEEMEIDTDPATISHLEQIQDCGSELLSLINKHLDPASLNSNNFALTSTFSQIPLELEPYLKTVINSCKQLLEQTTDELVTDLGKISTAAQSLLVASNDITNIANRYFQLNNVENKSLLKAI